MTPERNGSVGGNHLRRVISHHLWNCRIKEIAKYPNESKKRSNWLRKKLGVFYSQILSLLLSTDCCEFDWESVNQVCRAHKQVVKRLRAFYSDMCTQPSQTKQIFYPKMRNIKPKVRSSQTGSKTIESILLSYFIINLKQMCHFYS